jgi:hypothetical protein
MLGAVVLLLVAVLGASCGGSSPSVSSSAVRPSTARVDEVSTTPAVSGVTEPAAADSNVSTSSPGRTTETTSTVEPSDVLVAALPRQSDLPQGWVLATEQATTVFRPGSGPFIGSCSGGNADSRALERNAFGVANGAAYDAPRGAWGYASIVGFPTVDDARSYMDLTRDLSVCTQQFAVREGSTPGTYDGFADAALDGKQEWSVTETVTNSVPGVSGVDEVLAVVLRDVLTSTLDRTTYSAQLDGVSVLERFGRFVLVANLSSYCCDSGYRESTGTDHVTLVDLLPAMDAIRSHARSVLIGR